MKRYDPFTRFSRRHLAGRAQRAVYLLLVGGIPGRSWSAAEAAHQTRLPLRLVEDTLDEFDAVGIADRMERANEPPRYHWRRTLEYLGDAADSAKWVDPVCEMPVMPSSPLVELGPSGREFRFCSAICRDTFVASPEVFTAAW